MWCGESFTERRPEPPPSNLCGAIGHSGVRKSDLQPASIGECVWRGTLVLSPHSSIRVSTPPGKFNVFITTITPVYALSPLVSSLPRLLSPNCVIPAEDTLLQLCHPGREHLFPVCHPTEGFSPSGGTCCSSTAHPSSPPNLQRQSCHPVALPRDCGPPCRIPHALSSCHPERRLAPLLREPESKDPYPQNYPR
jgi:hypothetical protein